VRRFFFGEEHAPRFLVAMLLAASALRLGGWGGLPDVGALDLVVVAAVAVFWAFQEWWLHKFLLHAPFKVSVCLSACVRAPEREPDVTWRVRLHKDACRLWC
jgi:hypothetical protein